MTLLASRIVYASLQQTLEVIGGAVVICAVIFELVRRQRLNERYAILWLLAGITVLVLSLGQDTLIRLSRDAGIAYAPSAVFAIAFLFVLAMLIQFSIAISRLSEQNIALAQRLALMQQRLEQEPGRATQHAESEPGARAEPPAESA